MPQDDLSASDYQALAEFRFQIRRFLAFSEQAAHQAGLEPAQHQMLLAVKAHGSPPTVGEMADRLLLRHHSAVGLLDRLDDGGLIRRERAPDDRRQVRLSLTRKGEAVLRKLTLEHRAEIGSAGDALAAALRKILDAR